MIMELFVVSAVPFVWAVIAQYHAGSIAANVMAQTI
jgi:hypothetical protein